MFFARRAGLPLALLALLALFALFALLGLLAGHCAPARAAEGESVAPQETESIPLPPTPVLPVPDPRGLLEGTREALRSSADWLARSVDRWFGDLRFDDSGGKVSDGRFTAELLKREGDALDHRVRFDARFRLPNVEKHAYLFAGRGAPRDAVADRPQAMEEMRRSDFDAASTESFFAGIGATFEDLFDLRIGLRSGPKLYAQARHRTARPFGALDQGLAAFSQTFFWSSADSLGSTTALSWEYAFGQRLTARWLNSATITRRTGHFEWSSLVGLYQAFPQQRQLAFEALALGVHGASVDVADAGLRLRFERLVYQDWLIGQVLVGHFWPRADASVPRTRQWAFGAGVQMRF